jgi:hypothetical protein
MGVNYWEPNPATQHFCLTCFTPTKPGWTSWLRGSVRSLAIC